FNFIVASAPIQIVQYSGPNADRGGLGGIAGLRPVQGAPLPPTPSVTAGPNSLSIEYVLGTAPPPKYQVGVHLTGDIGPPQLATTTDSGGQWLSASLSGSLADWKVEISVRPTFLPPGKYSGTITVSTSNTAVSPALIQVTLTVS